MVSYLFYRRCTESSVISSLVARSARRALDYKVNGKKNIDLLCSMTFLA
jgi:hypothetical protein